MHGTMSKPPVRGVEPSFPEFVVLIALMMGLTSFGIDNLLPAFPEIAQSFGVREANDLQLVLYVYTIGFGLSQIVYGPLSDVVGRRPAFLVGLAIYAVGCVLALVAGSLETMLLARFIQGAGAGAGRVLSVAIVRDRFSGREMARVMSLTMMVFIMVPVFAPTIGTVLMLAGGWRLIFGSMLVLALVAGAWFLKRMPETLHAENRLPPSPGPILAGLKTTVTCRAALGYSTAFGLQFACIMGYVGSAQQIFAGEIYGLGNMFPLVFGSVAAAMGVAALVNSRLVRKHGMRRISHAGMIAFLMLAIIQCGLALATAGRPPLVLFWLVLALSQFCASLVMPNFNAMAMEPLGRVAGTASSFVGSYTTLIGAILGGAIGQMFDGTVIPLAYGYLLLAIGVVLLVLWTERGRLFRPHFAESTA